MNTLDIFYALIPYLNSGESDGPTMVYEPKATYLILYDGSEVVHSIRFNAGSESIQFGLDDRYVTLPFERVFDASMQAFDIQNPAFSYQDGNVAYSMRPRVDILATEVPTFPLVCITAETLKDLATKTSHGEIVNILVRTAMPVPNFPNFGAQE